MVACGVVSLSICLEQAHVHSRVQCTCVSTKKMLNDCNEIEDKDKVM